MKNNWKGTRGTWTSLNGQVTVKGEFHDENICRINRSTEAEINEALIIEAGNVRQQIDCSLTELLKQRDELLKALEDLYHDLKQGAMPNDISPIEQLIKKIKGE